MADLIDIVAGVRQKLRDWPKYFQTDIDGDGVVQLFELPEVMVEESTLEVTVTTGDNTAVLSTDDYSIDARNGMLVFTNRLLQIGETLTVFGKHFQWFLDEDILNEARWWIQAMDESQQDDYLFTNLALNDPRFELTVRGTVMGCLWSLMIEASTDIDVRNPEGVDIPTSQRFAQLTHLVEQWTDRYHELSDRLNVGVDRIQITTLRRMSLSTGRLVPVYKQQEFDDQATPQRRFPLIDIDQTLYDPPRPASIPEGPISPTWVN